MSVLFTPTYPYPHWLAVTQLLYEFKYKLGQTEFIQYYEESPTEHKFEVHVGWQFLQTLFESTTFYICYFKFLKNKLNLSLKNIKLYIKIYLKNKPKSFGQEVPQIFPLLLLLILSIAYNKHRIIYNNNIYIIIKIHIIL